MNAHAQLTFSFLLPWGPQATERCCTYWLGPPLTELSGVAVLGFQNSLCHNLYTPSSPKPRFCGCPHSVTVTGCGCPRPLGGEVQD